MNNISYIIEQHSFIFYLFVLSNSLFVGSFLNVVIFRLPKIIDYEFKRSSSSYLGLEFQGESSRYRTFNGRSYCASCGQMIPFWNNIPVLSWIILRGRSSCCNQPFSVRYPVIEFITGAVSLAVFMSFEPHVAMFYCVAFWILLCIFMIDLDSFLIPDALSYPLLWMGLIYSATGFGVVSINQALFSVVGTYGAIWVLSLLLEKIYGEGAFIGGGDTKLIVASTAWMGVLSLPFVIAIGSIFTCVMFFAKKKSHVPSYVGVDSSKVIQFGPGLSFGFLIALFFNEKLMSILNFG
ncbi:prepilin peptidase [Aeromonas veronii]|uniref:Prepilin leader peptidase/N-methyltransferase n=1 Tax=Aeromonas veronii TaxID=654 RepID=A0A2T4MZX0_AERVE|nr:A24 family peptidase [Aeromonas veronii]PTH80128.1 hypothetical protein DAA48_16320 [Aeromonas veronii]